MAFTSKLTPEQWAEARRLRAEGAPFPAIARQFAVGVGTLRARAKKEGWPSLHPPAAAGGVHRLSRPVRLARPASAPRGMAVVRRSLMPRLYNLVDIHLKLTELRMQQKLTAAEQAVAKGEDVPTTVEDADKEMRHAGTAIKTISQVTELAPDLARPIDAGALSTRAATDASQADAFRREIADRIEKLIPPS